MFSNERKFCSLQTIPSSSLEFSFKYPNHASQTYSSNKIISSLPTQAWLIGSQKYDAHPSTKHWQHRNAVKNDPLIDPLYDTYYSLVKKDLYFNFHINTTLVFYFLFRFRLKIFFLRILECSRCFGQGPMI